MGEEFGEEISVLSSGTMSHFIKRGKRSCSFPSMDSMMKLAALLPEVSNFPEEVFRVNGVELALTWHGKLKIEVTVVSIFLFSNQSFKSLLAFPP